MAESKVFSDKIKDERFLNWIKANIATNYAKEGVQNFVLKVITNFHEHILDDIRKQTDGNLCSQCTLGQIFPCFTKNVCVKKKGNCELHSAKRFRPCPNKVCEHIKNEIRKAHEYGYPIWKNTRPENWCTNAWELAKCYMPVGYSNCTGIADTDFNGIVSVVANQKVFNLACEKDVLSKVRNTTNEVRHSPNLFIEEGKLKEHMENLVDFLNAVGEPKVSKTTEAVKRIDKLRQDTLQISIDDKREVVKTAIRETSKKHQRDILHQVEKALSKIQIATQTSLEEIEQKTKHAVVSIPEDVYQELKNNLKEDLVVFNEQYHSTLPVSPLIEEHDVPLTEFYVQPIIESTDAQNTAVRNSWTEPGSKIASLQDVFKTQEKSARFRNIYLSSVAGMGKTAFCKSLVMIWCQSQKPDENLIFCEADIIAMKDFEFVFLIPLRETCRLHCDVEDMIYHQIIQHLSCGHEYSRKFLSAILHREECLIILDGLDEWKHPRKRKCCCQTLTSIPHRKVHKHCTILSTTRPWKLGVLKLKASQIDKHLRITELGKTSTEKLIKNSISKLNPKETHINAVASDFNNEVQKKSLNKLKSFPLILSYLVCLWSQESCLGDSRCEIYSNLIGLHLSKGKERKHSQLIKPPSIKKRKIDMPDAVRKNVFCEQYFIFLTKLGHLAFETYIDYRNREYSLVFDKDVATNLLGNSYYKFSLSCGLLTEHRIMGRYMTRRYRVAFAHKSFQEFLAALYIFTDPHEPSTRKPIDFIEDLCNSFENILSISEFIIFLSGLCPQKATLLFQKLRGVISKSPKTSGYRSDMGSWNYFVGYNENMKKMQNLYTGCVEECTDNTREWLAIEVEDFIIDCDYKNEKYKSILQRLIEENRHTIKSVKVRDIRTRESFEVISNMLKCKEIQGLEKIDLKCNFEEKDLDSLLKNSKTTLKCFVIKGGKWEDDKWVHNCVVLSDESYKGIPSFEYLEKLYLRNIQMSHNQLETLLGFLSSKPSMKQLGLKHIECISHTELSGTECPGVSLNLSKHSQLQFLELGEIPVSNLEINTQSLEISFVAMLPSSEIFSSVLSSLQSAKGLRRFYCGFLTESEYVEILLASVPRFVAPEHIWLTNIDVGNSNVILSPEMHKLEKIVMMSVKMGSDFLSQLFHQAVALEQEITVCLFEVEIKPGDDESCAKDQIRNSKRAVILLDGKDEEGRDEFMFKTVPLIADG